MRTVTREIEIKTTDEDLDIKSKRDSLEVDIPDIAGADTSPGTQLRHIVEDIEARAESITKSINDQQTYEIIEAETTVVTESKVNESDVEIEEKRRSVRELVQRHESLVKESSVDSGSSDTETKKIKDKHEETVKEIESCTDEKHALFEMDVEASAVEEVIEQTEKVKPEESVPYYTETIDDLIEEEQKLKQLDDSNIIEPAMLESSETIESLELESPCKLPSPLEHQYPVYTIGELDVKEEEQSKFACEEEKAPNFEKVEPIVCEEDTTKTLEESSDIKEKMKLSEVEYNSEEMVECEGLELESVQQMMDTKPVEQVVPSAIDSQVYEQEITAETVEASEYVSAKSTVTDGDLVSTSVTTMEVLSTEAEEPQQKEQLQLNVDFPESSSETDGDYFDANEVEQKSEDKSLDENVVTPSNNKTIIGDETTLDGKRDVTEAETPVNQPIDSAIESKPVLDNKNMEELKPSTVIIEDSDKERKIDDAEKVQDIVIESAPSVAEEIEVKAKAKIVLKQTEKLEFEPKETLVEKPVSTENEDKVSDVDLSPVGADMKPVSSPVSDEDLVEKPTHVSRESSFDFPEKTDHTKTDVVIESAKEIQEEHSDESPLKEKVDIEDEYKRETEDDETNEIKIGEKIEVEGKQVNEVEDRQEIEFEDKKEIEIEVEDKKEIEIEIEVEDKKEIEIEIEVEDKKEIEIEIEVEDKMELEFKKDITVEAKQEVEVENEMDIKVEEQREIKIEEQKEIEVSEHDSYFIQDKQTTKIMKQTVLLSRQESNIEITLDECGDHDMDQAEISSVGVDETKERSEDISKDSRKVDKPLESDESKDTGDAVVDSTELAEVKTEVEEEPGDITETPIQSRLYSDIILAADEEMEGEPVGFSVEPTSDDENEYDAQDGTTSNIAIDRKEEHLVEETKRVTEVSKDFEARAEVIEVIEGTQTNGCTAEVIEVIEGDDDDVEPPSPSVVSETVEIEASESMKQSTSDYDLALSYTDRVVEIVDLEEPDSVTCEDKPKETDIVEDDSMVVVKSDKIKDDQEDTHLVPIIDTKQDTDVVEDIKSESENVCVAQEFIDVKEEDKDEIVEVDFKYNVDDFDESFIDRTESFIVFNIEDYQSDKEKLGKTSVKSDQNIETQTSKQQDLSSFSGTDFDVASSSGTGDIIRDDVESIESDSIEDEEINSFIEKRSDPSVEPEQQSLKSSERPLSPTDYTLEMDLDESAHVGDANDADVDDQDDIENENFDVEGRISADVSQQIFIEQSIEQRKTRVRELGDGEEKVEEIPPSPSDYTLVTSYEQEKLKEVLSTPEKRSPQLARVFREEVLSVSMDESVLKKELGIERDIMSASYDEEALKYVYDEDDIMVSSAEHPMQDSLVASSVGADDVLRITGSVCSARDEEYSVSSSEHRSMTDSYDQDSLQKSVGSARESGMADSLDPDMLQRALSADIMTTSMDQEALKSSLTFDTGISSSMDQDALKKSLGLDVEGNEMTDSIEQEQMHRSLDVVREEVPLTNSLDDEIMEKALGYGRASVMETSMDQDQLRVSLAGDKTADLMTTSLEFDDLDALHRSLGLAGSESSIEQPGKLMSGITEESPTEASEGMLESMDEEALRKSFDLRSEDPMASSMGPDALKPSLGMTDKDKMSTSDDQDALKMSGSSERTVSSSDDSFDVRHLKKENVDPMMMSMDQDALQASLGIDQIVDEEPESKLMADIEERSDSEGIIVERQTGDAMMMSMEPDALRASLGLDQTIEGSPTCDDTGLHDDSSQIMHATADDTASISSEQAAILQTPDQSEGTLNTVSGFSNDLTESEVPPPQQIELEAVAAIERKKMVSSYENVYSGVPLEPTVNRMSMDASEMDIGDRFDTKQSDSKLDSGLTSSYEKLYDPQEKVDDEERQHQQRMLSIDDDDGTTEYDPHEHAESLRHGIPDQFAQKTGPVFIDPQYGDSEEDEVVDYQDDDDDDDEEEGEDVGARGGDTQTTRITMKKEIHTTTVLKDGEEQTFVHEDSKVETDPNAPEELRESMQQIIDEFMGSPTESQKPIQPDQ
ncbi:hypothetical protein ACF0H5_001218 [Mactra antiquata]